MDMKRKKEQNVGFTVVNHSPKLTPEQRQRRMKFIEHQLYQVFHSMKENKADPDK